MVMVTFTLPELLRALFFTPDARQIYDLFFRAAAEALSETLANPRWLGAHCSGFTMILHTWNQRLHFHPHLHCITPGAGLDATGRVVTVKSPGFLVPQPVLRAAFRARFRQKLAALAGHNAEVPAIDPSVWEQDWGVHLQAFGDGRRAIQYLGAYVCQRRFENRINPPVWNSVWNALSYSSITSLNSSSFRFLLMEARVSACHALWVWAERWRAKGPQTNQPRATPWVTGRVRAALKGRNNMCRPFRACSFFSGFPGLCPGLACFRTFGAPSRRAPKVHDRL
jgi:hypothetical protein